MTLLCDTHVLIWFALGNPKLGAQARETLLRALSVRRAFFSAASAWEFATLRAKKIPPFQMSPDTLFRNIAGAGFREVPITGDIALAGHAEFYGIVSDPADYFIAATAADLGASLMTADRALLRSRKIPTLNAGK